MFLLKPILDLIFFKNPVLILVFSFAILSLAVLLDGRTGSLNHKSQHAIKMGPPEIVRIEDFSKEKNSGVAGEINVLAEIDPSDLFKITIDTKGAIRNSKYILPLYAATEPSTGTHDSTVLNKTSQKNLIGALVSDDENVFQQALTLSAASGQIGPIVKVNGLPTTFGTEYEALAKENLEKLEIEYGYYGNNPIYIEAFFGNRYAILTEETAIGIQSDIIYIIAYMLIAIAYYRSIAQIIAIAKGKNDPSIINAVIKEFGKRSASKPVSTRNPSKPVSTILNITQSKPDPFNRLSKPGEVTTGKEETASPLDNEVYLREVRKA